MSAAAQTASMSRHAFLALVESRPAGERWELIDGRPVMMVNVTRAHSLIAMNIAAALHPVARSRGCETHAGEFFTSGGEGFLAAPDVFVRCGQGGDRDRFTDDPVLVVEVLSPSTLRHDRVTKFARYTDITSLQQIVLVYQDEIRVESFVREGEDWPMRALTDLKQVLDVRPLTFELGLSTIYQGTQLEQR